MRITPPTCAHCHNDAWYRQAGVPVCVLHREEPFKREDHLAYRQCEHVEDGRQCELPAWYGEKDSDGAAPRYGDRCCHHRQPTMVCTRTGPCSECNDEATHFPPDKPDAFYATHCKAHATGPSMHPNCEQEGCKLQGVWAKDGCVFGSLCTKHATMLSKDGLSVYPVRFVKCATPQCMDSAVYGRQGDTYGRICGTCRNALPDRAKWVNLRNPKCRDCGKVQPSFAPSGSTVPLYCRGCADKRGTIDEPMVSARYRECDICDRYAIYGVLGEPPTRCAEHHLPGMVERPTMRCQVCRASAVRLDSDLAVWGRDGQRARCNAHKLDDDVDLISSCMCDGCGFSKTLDPFGVCYICSPDKPWKGHTSSRVRRRSDRSTV